MPAVKVRASAILSEFEEAQIELLGKAAFLTDGKVGTVEIVSLDELHGLRISIRATMESGLSPPSSSHRKVEIALGRDGIRPCPPNKGTGEVGLLGNART
jgi:hypothetical protein